MDVQSRRRQAQELIDHGYTEHMTGEVESAVRLYQASLACYPTAEGHTYLAWSYSFLGRLEDAIAECKKAIALDPDYGNPYNDIGSYLIHLGKHEEAEPWLELALKAARYEPRHYAHCNLGRVYAARGELRRALEAFEASLALEPGYDFAVQCRDEVLARLN